MNISARTRICFGRQSLGRQRLADYFSPHLAGKSPAVVRATLSTGTATLEAAGLGFLGLGAQPPEGRGGDWEIGRNPSSTLEPQHPPITSITSVTSATQSVAELPPLSQISN
ncbi:MAG: hypothetical protein WBA89_23350 [Microcoleus sp.]|uniref:hypothetical protein n=1 Tax=Microcoleus sp. TaxID=44472 RepID=UPI003C749AFB